MAKVKITETAAINAATLAPEDLVPVVDVSDTTMSSTGTNKAVTVAGLATDVGAAIATDVLTTNGDILTRSAAGVPARVTRADLAADAAFTGRFRPAQIVVDAAGNGDFTSVTAALAAVPAGGANILVRRGTYNISTGTLIPSNVTLIGEGAATILRRANNVDQNVLNTAVGSVNITIANLTIDGNTANNTTLANGIAMFGAYTTVTNCDVRDVTGYGIVGFPGSSDLVIEANRVRDCDKEGIEVQGGSRVTIANNLVRTAGFAGVLIWANTAQGGTCADISVTGNVISGHGAATANSAIRVDDGARNVTVAGNVIGNAALPNSYGIGVFSLTAARVENVSVTGNVVTGANQSGIYVNNASAVTVANNNISGTTVGIQTFSTAVNVTIDSNTLISTSNNAITGTTSTGLCVTGNVVTSCGGTTNDSLKFEAVSGLTVTGNHVRLGGTNGIYIAAGTTEFAVVGNTCALNRDSGILVLDASHGTITGNVCRSNGTRNTGSSLANGVTLFQLNTTCTNIVVSSNRCYDSQGTQTQLYGIRMVGATDAIQHLGNMLAGNATGGLLVSGTATNTSAVPHRRIAATVNSTQTTIAHGLPYTPISVSIAMTSAGTVWRSASSDATNVYLTADTNGRTCDVFVG